MGSKAYNVVRNSTGDLAIDRYSQSANLRFQRFQYSRVNTLESNLVFLPKKLDVTPVPFDEKPASR